MSDVREDVREQGGQSKDTTARPSSETPKAPAALGDALVEAYGLIFGADGVLSTRGETEDPEAEDREQDPEPPRGESTALPIEAAPKGTEVRTEATSEPAVLSGEVSKPSPAEQAPSTSLAPPEKEFRPSQVPRPQAGKKKVSLRPTSGKSAETTGRRAERGSAGTAAMGEEAGARRNQVAGEKQSLMFRQTVRWDPAQNPLNRSSLTLVSEDTSGDTNGDASVAAGAPNDAPSAAPGGAPTAQSAASSEEPLKTLGTPGTESQGAPPAALPRIPEAEATTAAPAPPTQVGMGPIAADAAVSVSPVRAVEGADATLPAGAATEIAGAPDPTLAARARPSDAPPPATQAEPTGEAGPTRQAVDVAFGVPAAARGANPFLTNEGGTFTGSTVGNSSFPSSAVETWSPEGLRPSRRKPLVLGALAAAALGLVLWMSGGSTPSPGSGPGEEPGSAAKVSAKDAPADRTGAGTEEKSGAPDPNPEPSRAGAEVEAERQDKSPRADPAAEPARAQGTDSKPEPDGANVARPGETSEPALTSAAARRATQHKKKGASQAKAKPAPVAKQAAKAPNKQKAPASPARAPAEKAPPAQPKKPPFDPLGRRK